jgi:DsbC/DsbD-like thiol-disulfide interchange protein
MKAVTTAALILTVAAIAAPAAVQVPKFRPEVQAQVVPAEVRAGSTVRATVRLRLPPDVHVQSNTPRDPALIPTTLTVTPPAGVTVERITYPPASDLKQPGRDQPLAVFSADVVIEARLTIAADVAVGSLTVPATLRYQGCNDQVCFPPARAPVEWILSVAK